MADPTGKFSRLKQWYADLIAPAQWEAPDRAFSGHRDVLTRSLARYLFVAPRLHGEVLEVGCARGYGIEAIQPHVSRVTGLDISGAFLRAARARLGDTPLLQASGSTLPFRAEWFDGIVAFEVVEHIQDDERFLLGLRRVARAQACIAISTPNKRWASGEQDKPLDRFHVREYTHIEFKSLLSRCFSRVDVYGQRERSENRAATHRLIDRIPVQYKYVLPAWVQGLVSVWLRPPLSVSDCIFAPEKMDAAHTFVALCYP